MVRFLTVIVVLASFGVSSAQWSQECDISHLPVVTHDSFYFDAGVSSAGLGKLIVDTSFPGNIWQIGAVQKTGFPGAYSGTHALQTDTLLSYPVDNESSAFVFLDISTIMGSSASLIFWQYHDTDTLQDSCLLQLTLDSGKTWQLVPPNGVVGYMNITYTGSATSGAANGLWWSGKSNGWQMESICLSFLGIKGMQFDRNFGFRFLFVSDTAQTFKPGWMIDNIRLRHPQSFIGVKDVTKINIIAYPNPSATGTYHINYPANYTTGRVHIYDVHGRQMKAQPLARSISISDLSKGIYYYRIRFDQTGQLFTGSLVYH